MDARLELVLAHFERLGGADGWSCDGGAGVLSDLLLAAGVPNELEVGIYHWPEEMMTVRRQMIDDPNEHHHWVEAEGLIIDPNGELRGEPHMQPAGSARYEASSDWDMLQFSPYFDTDGVEDWELVEVDTLEVLEESAVYDPAVARYLSERETLIAALRPSLTDLAGAASQAEANLPAPSVEL